MEKPIYTPLPTAKVVVMGDGNFAVGSTFSHEMGMHCLMYLTLPERREPGTDTTDIYPVGSRAQEPAALIYFKTPAAIRQTMGYLAELLAEAEGKTSSDAMIAALDSVIQERVRQVQIEGWTPEHDDEHAAGALGKAGGFYALNAGAALHFGTTETSICGDAPSGWPWASEWWKPKNSRHDLVKAGALIIAEIERLDRAEARLKGGA